MRSSSGRHGNRKHQATRLHVDAIDDIVATVSVAFAAASKVAAAQAPAIEAQVRRIVGEGRDKHPSIPIDPVRLAAHLAANAEHDVPMDVLRRTHGADLHLALACLDRHPEALRLLDTLLEGPIRATILRMKVDHDLADETLQRLRVQLLVPAESGKAGLTSYRAHGRLSSWLRLAAVRLAARLSREHQHPTQSEASALAMLVDPERELLAKSYAGDVRALLNEALANLTVRERNLLRQRFMDDLGVEDLAALYHVHNSSICRWLAAIQANVLGRVRTGLKTRFGLDLATIDSILALAANDRNISFSQLFSTR